jgi:alpha-tubulin suppressor-like RCC1 family protein
MNGRRPLSPVPAAAWVVLALVAGACSRDSATTGPSHVVGKDFAANLRLVSGDQQVGAIASALVQPVKVKVVDAGGQPVQGATVTFSVRAGGGSINPAANISDATGIVSSVWTMGTTLGAAKVVALLTNSFVLDSTTFTATATVGPPRLLVKVSGDSQASSAGRKAPSPLIVRVQDDFGNKLSGVKVTWTPGVASGTASFGTDTTAADGTARADWTLDATPGTNTLTLAVSTVLGPVTGSPMVFTAAGTPTPITLNAGNNQTAVVGTAVATPPSVIVRDANGLPVSGVSVTFVVTSGGGTIIGTTVTTGASGIAAVANWTLGTTAGTNRMTATSGTLPGSPITFTATGTPDATRVVTWTAPTSTTLPALAALDTLRVRVTDQYLNPIVAVAVTWNDSIGGGGTLSSTAGTTDTLGNAKTVWTLGRRAGSQLLRSKVTGVAQTKTFTASATLAFSDVFAGNFMACGIVASNNNVYCWGTGNDGQLGKGGFTNSNAPTAAVPQSGDTASGVAMQARQLTGGRNGFCALTIARSLYCWGKQFGAAGVASPASVTLFTGTGSAILPNAVFMGEDFGCLVSLAGDPFCTGNGINGQLGNGGTGGSAASEWLSVTPPDATLPLFASIGVGRSHACGVPRFMNAGLGAISQLVYCWGLNTAGQLGNGTTARSLVPGAVIRPLAPLPPLDRIRFDSASLSVGGTHACVLEALSSATPGRAWCWGGNGFGQLGDSSTTDRLQPVQVLGDTTRKFIRIFAGEYHTCGITGTPGAAAPGAAYCWGRNDYGQLGNGAVTIPLSVPTLVSGLSGFRSLSLGELFTCGVTAGTLLVSGSPSQLPGTAYCWGDNLFGQLGTNANIPILNPTLGRVSFQP